MMEMTGKEFTQQMLSNLMALHQAIMDIERTVRSEATQAGIRADLGFLQADDVNIQAIRSIFQQTGLQDKGPDEPTKKYIDTTRQILGMSVSPRVKLNTYGVLLSKAHILATVMARAAFINGDKSIYERLAVIHLNDTWKRAMLITALASIVAEAMKAPGGGGGPQMGIR